MSFPGCRPSVIPAKAAVFVIPAKAAIQCLFLLALCGFISPRRLIADDRKFERITTDGDFKQRPSWSPDGKRVAFCRHRGNSIALFLRDLSTGQDERVTTGMSLESDPIFSPDGLSLLYTFDKTSPGQGDFDVYRMILAERKPLAVATTQGGLSHEEWPAWSPDGKQCVLTSTRHGNPELYVVAIEGGDWRRLTDDLGIDTHPAWSPDGKSIAFATSRWGNLEIAVLDLATGSVRRITDSRGVDDYPAWSPSGAVLAFTSRRDGNEEIYLHQVDGSEENVSGNPGLDNFAAWTPDGRIGFISERDGDFDVYVSRQPVLNAVITAKPQFRGR